jgi:hypothetical protein
MFQNFHAPSFGIGALVGAGVAVGVGALLWPDSSEKDELIQGLSDANKRIVSDANSIATRADCEIAVASQKSKLKELKLQEVELDLLSQKKANDAAEKRLADRQAKLDLLEEKLLGKSKP